MPPTEFGIFDEFPHDRRIDADVLDEHICDVQAAEQLGYGYYFFIEHQNAGFPCMTAPNVYLAALARATSSIRIGPMVYQMPIAVISCSSCLSP